MSVGPGSWSNTPGQRPWALLLLTLLSSFPAPTKLLDPGRQKSGELVLGIFASSPRPAVEKIDSTLAPKDLEDLLKNTEFSEQEIKEWYDDFLKDCPSGLLNLEGLQQLYTKFFPNGDASKFTQYIFRVFDKNGNGTIDFREFMIALSITSRGSTEEKANWTFEMYDQDQDGRITRLEMLEMIEAIYKMVGTVTMKPKDQDGLTPQQRVDRIFEKMDQDKDDQITLEEFKEAVKSDPTIVSLLMYDTQK